MYYLESELTERRIVEFPVFIREAIRQAIIQHLQSHPTDTVHYYKVSDDDEFVGDDLIDFYAINPRNGKTSKLVFKGEKIFYKSLV
jgi:hypothetical protein